jgi:hypothetical protein
MRTKRDECPRASVVPTLSKTHATWACRPYDDDRLRRIDIDSRNLNEPTLVS